jgi:predicted porin
MVKPIKWKEENSVKKIFNGKKSLLALAVLGTIAGSACAQSNVTIYGIVDAGLLYTNNQPTGNGTGSATGMISGGLSPTIIGFKGSEDLGGGLKVGFALEDDFWTTTGNGGIFGGLFARQANVSLSSGVGTLTLGRQYSPAVLAFAATDPRGLKETFSGLESWALIQGPNNTNSTIDVFISNAISASAKFGDVNVAALYSLGGTAGSTSSNSVFAVGATYSGPLTVSASYQQDDYANPAGGLTGTATQKYSVGGGYTFGDATVKLNYLDNKNKSPATDKEVQHFEIFGLGLDYRTAANNTATLAYYHSKDKDLADSDSDTWIVSDEYSLSKRTTLYGLIAGVNAKKNYDGGAAFGAANTSTAYLAGVNGNTTTAVEFGIKHSF